jgi:hypothetical protein
MNQPKRKSSGANASRRPSHAQPNSARAKDRARNCRPGNRRASFACPGGMGGAHARVAKQQSAVSGRDARSWAEAVVSTEA